MNFSAMIVPFVIMLILLYSAFHKVDIAEVFTRGAREGLHSAAALVPMLVLLLTAVGMFTSSGAADMISRLAAPLAEKFGFPPECLTLALIRPFTGGGALAAVEELLTRVGADSFPGKTAAVLMASTETTFYTIAVYSAALEKKPDGRIFLAAAAADLTGFILSPIMVRLFT
ncbi:nucleoside recognition domain-containing protein [Ruminococcus sp.]|uniref:nucleoside recognition domain-containing protein n=1 Tax=Ruminococcus sp. TaxID=41978 RepID=UPI0025D74C5C|nr:nucleoside recognition domain-containing protein [Ruminococcus sp.]MBQ8966426.1 spore maturation protein [Ruminococcus sp.]